ncbi:MAG TPA: hypothetical protein DCY13_07205 [Verrucomicrobiales bacterium]|nr:hypothetical protein [Verrucomicrobiales bacterium]
MANEKPKEAAAPAAGAAGAAEGGGGIKAMLPLILTVVLMPAMAFVMTQFVLLPKIQQAIKASAATLNQAGDGEAVSDGEVAGEPAPADGSGPVTLPKGSKVTHALPKIIVNISGSQGTRYLMSSYTLVGKGGDFTAMCTANESQLRDVAMGVLYTKTIQDLEKPDARNLIRAELISTFNTALGKPAVLDLYITEFVIQ